jgi:Fe2+ transport system protein B
MKSKRALILSISLLSSTLLFSAVPVYARNGADDTTTATNTTTLGNTTTTTTETKPEVEHKTEVEIAHEKAAEANFRKKGAETLAELKKEKKDTKTTDELKKKCEVRKDGLQNKVNNLVTNAQKYQDKITGVYTKVVAYQKDNNLTVTNWSTLVAAADAAKAQSQVSVGALTTLKPTVDCNKTTVAGDVANFKAAAAQARTDLAAYRTAVKALLTAAETAKGGQQ